MRRKLISEDKPHSHIRIWNATYLFPPLTRLKMLLCGGDPIFVSGQLIKTATQTKNFNDINMQKIKFSKSISSILFSIYSSILMLFVLKQNDFIQA